MERVSTASSARVNPERYHSPTDTTNEKLSTLQHLTFQRELTQLNDYEKQDSTNQQLWQQRRQALIGDIRKLSTWELLTAATKEAINRICFLRNGLMKNIIHPAISLRAGLDTEQPNGLQSNEACIADLIDKGRAERHSFLTPDHVLLDGLLLKGKPSNDGHENPIMVINAPNIKEYEDLFGLRFEPNDPQPILAWLADEAGVDIFLYNDKGIGRSLGHEYSLEDSIMCAQTAIGYAAEKFHRTINVMGISLGAAVMSQALSRIKDNSEPCAAQIGVNVNFHSFTSLAGVVTGSNGGSYYSAIKKTLWMLGINNLDTLGALAKQPLAPQTWVIVPKIDSVIPTEAFVPNHVDHEQELDTLKPKPDSRLAPTANVLTRSDIFCFREHGEWHCDLHGALRNSALIDQLKQTVNEQRKNRIIKA